MGTFQLTKQAKSDLKAIAAYTQRKWGKEQRNIYLRQFDDAFHLLAEAPEKGKTCDYIKIGYRKFPIKSHVIFYRILSNSEIQIARILHRRMDAKPHFSNS